MAPVFDPRRVDDHERLVGLQSQPSHFLGVKDRNTFIAPWCLPRSHQPLLHGQLDELLRDMCHPVQREAVLAKICHRDCPLENLPSLTCSGSNISRKRHSSSCTTPGEISGAALTRSSKCSRDKELGRKQRGQVVWQAIRHAAFIGQVFLTVLVARVVGKGARPVEPEVDVQTDVLPEEVDLAVIR